MDVVVNLISPFILASVIYALMRRQTNYLELKVLELEKRVAYLTDAYVILPKDQIPPIPEHTIWRKIDLQSDPTRTSKYQLTEAERRKAMDNFNDPI